MKFKRKLIALLSVMCVIFTTGCEKAPEEVIKENEILNNAEIPSDKDNLIEYATMDEIRASVDEVIKNNTTNIQVDKIHISEGKTMPSYTVKLKKAFDEQDLVEIDNLMTYLYGEYDNTIGFDNASGFYEDYDITSEQYWFGKDDSGREMDILNYHPANIDVMQGGILLWSCGWSYVVDSTVFDYGNGNICSNEYLVKEYFPLFGDEYGDDAYILTDGKEMKVSDAVKMVEDFYNNKISVLTDNTVSFRAQQVDVYGDEGVHVISVYVQMVDKNGNNFDNRDFHMNLPESYNDGKTPYIFYHQCKSDVTRTDKLTDYCIEFVPVMDEVINNGEELVSFESALNILSSRLATSAMYEFDAIELKYYMVAEAEKDSLPLDENGEPLQMGDWYFKDEIKVRPYWAFTDYDMNTRHGSVSGGEYLIDAVTGELYIY